MLGLDPKNAMAFNSRGLGYAAKGDYDRAIDDLDRAIQLDPKNATSYIGRCATRIKNGEIDQALNDCNQAIHSIRKMRWPTLTVVRPLSTRARPIKH